MSWVRLFLLRLFRVPVTVTIQRLEVKGDDIRDFSIDHWEGIARLFILVPGLRQVWEADLADAIESLSKLPTTPEYQGERIRLGQLVAGLKRNLDTPRLAVDRVNTIRAQQQADLKKSDPKPTGAANLV